MFADLVLEGGGVKGIALVGAISVLEERGYRFRRVAVALGRAPARLTDADGRDSWLMDGAILSRFPIDVFDAPAALQPRWPTFGIKLGAAPPPASRVHNTLSMSRAMLKTMTGIYDRRHVEDPAVTARTIVVNTGSVGVTDFGLDRGVQDALFRKGRDAALNFLDGAPGQPGWDWEAYKHTHRSGQAAA